MYFVSSTLFIFVFASRVVFVLYNILSTYILSVPASALSSTLSPPLPRHHHVPGPAPLGTAFQGPQCHASGRAVVKSCQYRSCSDSFLLLTQWAPMATLTRSAGTRRTPATSWRTAASTATARGCSTWPPAKSSATSPRGRTSPSPSLASTRSRAASAIILNLIFVFQTDEKYLNVDVPEKR